VLELRSGTFAQNRKRWERAMAQQWAAGTWCTPPDPRQCALLHQPTFEGVRTTPQEAQARMREIRDRLAKRSQPDHAPVSGDETLQPDEQHRLAAQHQQHGAAQ
jgi:hypothetical protein